MNKNYELPWEVFETVLTNSTWGSSQVGGPVWVWDFRIKELEKLCPSHPEIEKLKQIWQEADRWKCREISGQIQQEASKIISTLGLCNILVITDGSTYLDKDGKRITFHSLFSFLQRMHLLLYGRKKDPLSGAPLRIISFILRDQSQKIKHDDYIWKISLDENKLIRDMIPRFPSDDSHGGLFISRKFPDDEEGNYYVLPYYHPDFWEYADDKHGRHFKMKGDYVVRQTSNWKQYLPNLVYDCMELTFMKYWRCMNKDFSYTQYPLMFYNDEHVAGTALEVEISYYDKPQQLKLTLPALANQEIWHREFYPKERWQTRKDV